MNRYYIVSQNIAVLRCIHFFPPTPDLYQTKIFSKVCRIRCVSQDNSSTTKCELDLYIDTHISPATNIATRCDLKIAVGHIAISIKCAALPRCQNRN